VHRLAYANHYLYSSIVQSLIVICQLEGLSINETPLSEFAVYFTQEGSVDDRKARALEILGLEFPGFCGHRL
jgi:hypothetical protein